MGFEARAVVKGHTLVEEACHGLRTSLYRVLIPMILLNFFLSTNNRLMLMSRWLKSVNIFHSLP